MTNAAHDLPFLIGAYASTSGDLEWQAEYYNLLAQEEWVGGLEIPFFGESLREDHRWFAAQMKPAFSTNVLTPIPGVMKHITDKTWGIASADDDGREAALHFLERAADTMREMNDLTGRKFFSFLSLHTAPQEKCSAEALQRSLETLVTWDLDGAELTIEHCDAWTDEHPVEKGFLSLDDELAAIDAVGAPHLYASINWGRDAIEGRNAQLPLEHIKQVAASGHLAGMILSGAQDQHDGQWGPWVDAHIGLHEHQPESVLTRESAHAAFEAALAAAPKYIGTKISINTGSNSERIALLREIAEIARAA